MSISCRYLIAVNLQLDISLIWKRALNVFIFQLWNFFSLDRSKRNMDTKENSAVTSETPQTLDNPHSPAQNNTTALTCPSHIDSPPEGPNQFLLFSDTLPAWTCSGHQRHSSIRPGWLWLISPPNDQFVSLSLFPLLPSPSLLFPSLSPSLHSLAVLLMCRIWWKSESADGVDTAACESNNAITIWPWRTANSYVHLSLCLTHGTFHVGESLQIIHGITRS